MNYQISDIWLVRTEYSFRLMRSACVYGAHKLPVSLFLWAEAGDLHEIFVRIHGFHSLYNLYKKVM